MSYSSEFFRTNLSYVVFFMGLWSSVSAQTLQQVTDNGAITNKGIAASSVSVNSNSLAGSALPTNIDFLNGYRINGSIPNVSQNGITYQSGGGGGAAIGFFRGGSYETGIDFYTNSSNAYGNIYHRMRIDNNGNVGIGTTNPLTKLQVNSDLEGTSAISIGAPNSSGHIDVPLGGSPGGYNIDFYSWRDVVPNQIGARIRAERINIYQSNNALVQAMDLCFYTSRGGVQEDLLEKMRIGYDGNVSIGTNDAKGYKLAVAGNMIAESVKVKLQGTWPDFVFAKDYALPSLAETEKHIKEKGHLPGIPSATEVKSNGIDLGEMNAKLLRKIEELTLQLIEQNRKFEAKFNTQQLEIDTLKLKLK